MKLGKFTGRLPFGKHGKDKEIESASELDTIQYEEEANALATPDGQPLETGENIEMPVGESTGQENLPVAPVPAGIQEPVSEQKVASKAKDLFSELKEIQSSDTSPIHILADSLDEVDINNLLAESRAVATKLRGRVGRR